MLRAGLDWGRHVVRGDVQTRLFGGAAEVVGRLVRFSDGAMIIMQARRVTDDGDGDGDDR
jgi:hypothetical protein